MTRPAWGTSTFGWVHVACPSEHFRAQVRLAGAGRSRRGAGVPGRRTAVRVAGQVFTDVEALRRAVRRQLAGAWVWGSRDDRESQDGLRAALLREEVHARLLAEAVAEGLGDADAVVRTGAACQAWQLGRVLGAEELAVRHEAHAHLLEAVPPRGHSLDQADLAEAVLTGVAAHVRPHQEVALALLRREAAGPRCRVVLGALARAQPDWLVAQARLVPPELILGLLRQLSEPVHRASLVAGLPWTPETAAACLDREAAWANLPLDPEEREALRRTIPAPAPRR